MKKLIIACCLVFTSVTSFSQDAYMVELMDSAKKLMKYNEPLPHPKIVPTTVEHMKSIVCKGIKYCPVAAVYWEQTIYYDKKLDLNSPMTKSILVHEFVHHIQSATGFDSYDCSGWYSNERQAYRMQAKYLRNNDQDDSFVFESLRAIKCK